MTAIKLKGLGPFYPLYLSPGNALVASLPHRAKNFGFEGLLESPIHSYRNSTPVKPIETVYSTEQLT